MKRNSLFIFAFVLLWSMASPAEKFADSPTLFADGVINTVADEYNPTFAPDGKTVYFTRRVDRKGNEAILFSTLANGKWMPPQTATFSGKFYDKEPFVSPDGKRIFFASMRPNGRGEKANFDIWYVEKNAENDWSEPKNLGANVNSLGYDNYPAVAADGTLYFASARIDGRKDNDLYRSRLQNGEYLPAENLGASLNTNATEADPFVAPDQSYLIFCSDRNGGAGEGDLYVSFNENGAWTEPQSLGKIINTAEYEYTPLVFGDKFYFSRGWGDIYEMSLKDLNLENLRKTAKIAANNSAKKQKYLFYLHGKIVEDQGAKAISKRYGAYEYDKIVEGFRREGFNVVSEARPKGTDVEAYAEKTAAQIREVLENGIAPEDITVVGASKGAFIALLVSTFVKNKNVNYVILAGCGVNDEFLKMANLYGNVLSIYEKSDMTGSCQRLFDDAGGLNKRKEIMLETGIAHGFIYKPMREWLVPTLDWANLQK